jgi:hypothetical protein
MQQQPESDVAVQAAWSNHTTTPLHSSKCYVNHQETPCDKSSLAFMAALQAKQARKSMLKAWSQKLSWPCQVLANGD